MDFEGTKLFKRKLAAFTLPAAAFRVLLAVGQALMERFLGFSLRL
jgi:hypothetical protein